MLMAGCNSWLDVESNDKVQEDQVYKTEQGINSVVNGFYMGLAGEHLYGFDMTMSVTEAMAQYYTYNSNSPAWLQQIAAHDYIGQEGSTKLNQIWSAYYSQIMDINTFIGRIDGSNAVSSEKKDILKGEAHGLRAYLYFDLLRMFGPVYDSPDSTAVSIPYTDVADGIVKERLPANEIMDKIFGDIKLAEQYLKNDPIKTDGVVGELTGDVLTDFYRVRNKRMNYYAVIGLKARAALYRCNWDLALSAANEIIGTEVGETVFPWTSRETFMTEGDRVFSSEVVFGVYSQKVYDHWKNYFSSAVRTENAYTTLEANLKGKNMFNYSSGNFDEYDDWRTRLWPTVSGRTGTRTSNKYEETYTHTSYADYPVRYMQPLLRITELYYIKAEALLNKEQVDDAAALVNTVRNKRGLADVAMANVAAVHTSLRREYLIELFGEGQAFFYHKRRNLAEMMDANSVSKTVKMDGKYVIPIPTSED